MEKIEARLSVLTVSNYQRWKFDVIALLESKGLFDYVNGIVVKPELNENDALTNWKMNDAKAKSLLSMTLDDEHHGLIRSCGTSKEMWDAIINYREQSSSTNKILCHQQFYEHRFKPGDTVSNYLSELTVIIKKLKDLKVDIVDETIMAKIVNDLPKEFESFRTSWRLGAVGGLNLNLDGLKAQILVAERELRESSMVGAHEPNEALMAKKPIKQKKKFQRKCFRCGSSDHLIKDCLSGAPKNNGRPKLKNSCGLVVTQNYDEEEFPELDEWVFDTGASAHMTSNKSWLENYEQLTNPINFTIGDGRSIQAVGKGKINVKVYDGKAWSKNFMNEVLFVPNLGAHNLFSVGQAISKGHRVEIDDNCAKIISVQSGQVVVVAKRQPHEKVYYVLMKHNGGSERSSEETMRAPTGSACLASEMELRLWHERLGHVHVERIVQMMKDGLLPKFKVSDSDIRQFFCEGCSYGKMSRKPAYTSELRDCGAGEFIHCDLVGPMEEKSLSGSRYALVLKDELSSYRCIYFMKSKSEVPSMLQMFLIKVREECGAQVRRIRSDNGTEFTNSSVKELFLKNGIQHELSAPYTPQQNGRIERENRTLVESARSMLHARNLPKFLWAEALNTACYLLNRVITNKNNKVVPYELWTKKKPNYKELRPFGSQAFKLVPPELRRKWEPKAKKVIFVGYTDTEKNFRLYDPKTRRVEISKHVKFNELNTEPIFVPKSLTEVNDQDCSKRSSDHGALTKADLGMNHQSRSEIRPLIEVLSKVTERETGPVSQTSSSNGAQTEIRDVAQDNSRRYSDQYSIIYEEIEDSEEHSETSPRYDLRDRTKMPPPKYYSLSAIQEPSSYEEAVSSPDKEKWIQAMDEEITSLKENNTWVLVGNQRKGKPISCKWVYKIKRNPDGSIERYKARLVARGYTQRYGRDYTETFAPVVRFDSIRIILAIAAANQMILRQFDVKTAFLYGELHEELLMEQPPGYSDGSDMVCKLLKGLYGLKQSPRQWNSKFDKFLKKFGLISCNADQCVYVTKMLSSYTILALYVDDGLLCSTNEEAIASIETHLSSEFKIRFSGATCFVGMEIESSAKGIKIHQSSYIKRLLERFGMQDCKSILTPGDSHLKLSTDMCPKDELERAQSEKLPYQELVGALLFLTAISRPDISFEVSRATQFMSNHGEDHWKAAKRILRYLKGTISQGIWFNGKDLELRAYADADYAANPDTRKSTSGFVLTLSSGPVTWAARSQKSVAQSTTEAEYIALADCIKDVIWARQLLSDLGRAPTTATLVSSDNQAAIKLVRNPIYHRRTKHIDVRHHFIRDEQEKGTISVEFIPTNAQPADMLTKSLCSPNLNNCKHLLMIRD